MVDSLSRIVDLFIEGVAGCERMSDSIKWFKVVSKNLKAKDGGCFDYAPFVGSKKWTPIIKNVKVCSKGYHVTKYWNMFVSNNEDRIFEVEVKDLAGEEVLVGVCEKAVCSSIKLVKEFIPNYDTNRNTGNLNTGHWNTGDLNTGYRNTGDWNTGDLNTGNLNTGDSNTGNWNTGHWNTGDSNTRHWNTGNRNTGNLNTGNRNTGDLNTGNWNTGDWNTGNYHAGSFNTKEVEKVYLFDKEILKTDYDKIVFPSYFYFELNAKLGYQKSWIKSFKQANKDEIKTTINLPNFDFEVFEQVTGITKKMITKRLI